MNEFYSHIGTNTAVFFTEFNCRYLTGFSCDNGILAINSDKKVFYTDGRYIEAAKNTAYSDIEVRLLKNYKDALSEIKADFCGEFLIESDITARDYKKISGYLGGGIQSDEIGDLIISARSKKKQDEVECIIKAQRIAEKAFLDVLNFIKPGVKEKDIAAYLEYRAKLSGADAMAFETIAISGKNTSMPHGRPSDKTVENGEFVTMDFGCKIGGYCSDMTRTVAVGSISDEMAKVYDIVLKAGNETIKNAKPGVKCSDADAFSRDYISSFGYGEYFNHSTGHGVGLEVHESPNLSPKSSAVLEKGNIVTVEPGIYLEGKFGVRIEDMLLITENGAENLTKSEKNLIILK